MEGNLSLAEAKATVAYQAEAADAPADGHDSDVKQDDDGAWDVSSRRRRRVIVGSTLASAVWLCAFGFGIYWGLNNNQLATPSLTDAALLMSACMVPLCLIWLFTLVVQRTDPLLERRLAIARTLQASIAPVDAAEAKLDRLLERLQRDIGMVDQTVMLASDRISALEERFTEQVSNLFSATTDAEAKSATISDQLRREHDNIVALIGKLGTHLAEVQDTLTRAADKTLESENTSRQAFSNAADQFESQYNALLNASQTTTKGLNSVMDGLAERTTALDAAALSATQKLGKGITVLKAHEHDYRGFIDRFTGSLTAFEATIDGRLEALEAAQAQLDTVGGKTAENLGLLATQTQETVETALANTAAAAAALETHKSNVGVFARTTLAELDKVEARHAASLDEFKQHTEALSAQATQHIAQTSAAHDAAAQQLFDAIKTHVKEWKQELAGFDAQVSERTDAAGMLAQQRIDEARERLETGLEALIAATQIRIEGLEATVMERTTALSDAITAHQSIFDSQTESIDQQIDTFNALTGTLGGAVTDATSDVNALKGSLEASIQSLGDVAKTNAADMLAQLEHMSDQAQGLLDLPEAVTKSWGEALDKARQEAEHIQRESQADFSKILATADEMERASNGIARTITQSISELTAVAERLDYGMNVSENKLGDIRGLVESVDNAALQAQEKLHTMNEGFAELHGAMAQVNQADMAAYETAKADMENAVSAFEAMAQALRSKAADHSGAIVADYQAMLEQAGTLSQQTEEAARNAAHTISQSANKAMDLAKLKWADFSADKQHEALQQFDNLANSLKATLDSTAGQMAVRLEDIEAQSRAALAGMSDSAREAALKNKETMDLVAQLTRRVEQHTTSDLIRTSSLIVDALHSLSIDINKSFNSKLTDADWTKYLSGDRSIFTRQSIQALSRADRKALRKRLDNDAELKSTVLNYLKDFELLMARAMRGNEPTSLSVALVSSDIGKLYVALSQTLRRFR